MKRIVICCDGTWNSPDIEQNGIPIATNVAKIARAFASQSDRGIRQMMYYDPGVGTKKAGSPAESHVGCADSVVTRPGDGMRW